MRRQHVVVGGDDADVGPRSMRIAALSSPAAAKPCARLPQLSSAARSMPRSRFAGDQIEVAPARGLRPLDDPVGDGGDAGVRCHHYGAQWMSTRLVGTRRARGRSAPAMPTAASIACSSTARFFWPVMDDAAIIAAREDRGAGQGHARAPAPRRGSGSGMTPTARRLGGIERLVEVGPGEDRRGMAVLAHAQHTPDRAATAGPATAHRPNCRPAR